MLGITRETKRLIIIVIALFLFIALAIGAYFLFRAKPTCFDQIQNQNETGVDCGGVCALACMENVTGADIQVKEVTVIPAATGTFDVLGALFNPNTDIGASDFHYIFSLQDASGKELAHTDGDSWILPNETKSLLAFNISSSVVPAKATLTVSGVKWLRLQNYRGRPPLNIYKKRYNEITSGVGFAEATGIVANESAFDFRSITVKIILRDATGKAIAINQTQQNTMTAGERRDFRAPWPTAFPGTVANVDMEVDADVYHSANFEQQYFPGGRFQESLPNGNFR